MDQASLAFGRACAAAPGDGGNSARIPRRRRLNLSAQEVSRILSVTRRHSPRDSWSRGEHAPLGRIALRALSAQGGTDRGPPTAPLLNFRPRGGHDCNDPRPGPSRRRPWRSGQRESTKGTFFVLPVPDLTQTGKPHGPSVIARRRAQCGEPRIDTWSSSPIDTAARTEMGFSAYDKPDRRRNSEGCRDQRSCSTGPYAMASYTGKALERCS